MAIDQSFVGRIYPATDPYRVTREKIIEYVIAINDSNPVYRDVKVARACGYPDVIAPPAFAIVITLPAMQLMLQDPEAGIDYSRIVHGEQRFLHRRPLFAGDVVHAQCSIDDVRDAGQHMLIESRVGVTTDEGEAILAALTTTVLRGDTI